MYQDAKIYVAGHTGLVGSALVKLLINQGYQNIITRSSAELDLRNQPMVDHFFATVKPEYVFLAAAKVGGIYANNTYPADFIYDNLMITTNIIHAAHKYNTTKLLNLGSSCIYPKLASQPIQEESLLTGPLEPTNEAYSIAKIAGIKLCQYYHKQYGSNFISVMPTNLYGANDNFDLLTSHVYPALMRKFHEAKIANNPTITLWGSGTARREFLYVDDMVESCLFLMEHYNSPEIINVGTGSDLTIGELASLMAEITGFKGKIAYDKTKPDGTPVKRLDVSRINQLGWKAPTSLQKGTELTYQWLIAHYEKIIVKGSPE